MNQKQLMLLTKKELIRIIFDKQNQYQELDESTDKKIDDLINRLADQAEKTVEAKNALLQMRDHQQLWNDEVHTIGKAKTAIKALMFLSDTQIDLDDSEDLEKLRSCNQYQAALWHIYRILDKSEF